LAAGYEKQGFYEKGIIIATDASKIIEKGFGDNDPTYINSLKFLASMYFKSNTYSIADSLYKKALKGKFYELQNNFIHLSEQEKSLYIKSSIEYFNNYYIFIVNVILHQPNLINPTSSTQPHQPNLINPTSSKPPSISNSKPKTFSSPKPLK
jgi:hypothetical protein